MTCSKCWDYDCDEMQQIKMLWIETVFVAPKNVRNK